jgi:hypothetical protein
MKRLLVVANLQHASPRIPALLIPLVDLGWQIAVVTPPLGADAESELGLPERFAEKIEIIEAPYRGDIFWWLRKTLHLFGFSGGRSYTEQIKERVGHGGGGRSFVDRLMRAYQFFFAIPDTEWPWHRPAFEAALTKIANCQYDILLSSSPFPTVHRVAARIKKHKNIPWVADLRDLWSQNHNYPFSEPRRRLDRWMEIRTLRSADLLTTISQPLALKLQALHGDRVAVVRNGFQPVRDAGVIEFPEKFTISYTGTIYAGKQDPNKVLAALSSLIGAGLIGRDCVALNFYGRYDSALQEAIVSHGLVEVAIQQGTLPRAEIRRRQRSSHLLLLLQWEDPDEQGIFPLKFYEYLDSKRPILATGGAGSREIADILRETGAGVAVVGPSKIEQALLAAYEDYLVNGVPAYGGIPEAIAKYSYAGCARQLAEYLEYVCAQYY